MVKHFFSLHAWGLLVSIQVSPLYGATAADPSASPSQDHFRVVGAVTCQSSMCHGGASPSRDQFTIWSKDDFHSRAYATLVTARSTRMAETLGLASATEGARCTTCHAPFATLPAGQLTSTAHVTEGVSCESCHNDAANWLRGHTRYDWTYADRLHAGMRNLSSAYVRANTCVTCHQVLDPAIVKAGHPELIFELDGQTASEPRHWQEKEDWSDAKAWLVGQAVALREMSRQSGENADSQAKALLWLLRQMPGVTVDHVAADQPAAVADWSDQLAQAISSRGWTPAMSTDALVALSATADSFADATIPRSERELRAERLVLGLDRLFKSLHKESSAPGQAELSSLFAAVQDRDHFDPKAFSELLKKFAEATTKNK